MRAWLTTGLLRNPHKSPHNIGALGYVMSAPFWTEYTSVLCERWCTKIHLSDESLERQWVGGYFRRLFWLLRSMANGWTDHFYVWIPPRQTLSKHFLVHFAQHLSCFLTPGWSSCSKLVDANSMDDARCLFLPDKHSDVKVNLLNMPFHRVRVRVLD